MTGHKTLAQVRAELEAALGAGPTGGSEVAESLRRFLVSAAGVRAAAQGVPPAAEAAPAPPIHEPALPSPAGDLSR